MEVISPQEGKRIVDEKVDEKAWEVFSHAIEQIGGFINEDI